MNPGQPADFTSVPTIDIAALFSGDPAARAEIAEALAQAAREVGFFQIVGHGISAERRAALLAQTQQFFALDHEHKMDYYIGRSAHHRGYVPPGEEAPDPDRPDRKEAFDLAFEISWAEAAGTPMLGPNVWPELEGFRDAVYGYYEDAFAVGRALMEAFAVALDLPADQFSKHVTQPPSQLRLIHYPYDAAAEDAQGIGAHTDYECFTLLLPTAAGLEVMNGAGDWIGVPYREGALVVNIGDMLQIWTNGEFVATSHRVRKVPEERYSFPLFFACDYHTEVAPLPHLIARDGAANYEPLRAGEHLYAQTIQTFNYLQERLARGEIALPAGARGTATFGQHARHGDAS